MLLLQNIAILSQAVAATSSKRQKIALLAAGLQQTPTEAIGSMVTMLSGELKQSRLGYATLRGAKSSAAIRPTLSVLEVEQMLDRIAHTSGSGSAAERKRILAELFGKATAEEQDFLERLLLGELRQGATAGLMVEAIAQAAKLPLNEIRRATMLSGELVAVARAALTQGRAGLSQFSISLFRPLQPMLAQTANTINDALQQLDSAVLEWKLDGARVQVHKSGSEVRLYSRNLNDVTAAAPELVELVSRLPAQELILDGETLVMQENHRPQAFQTTMRRFGRKLDNPDLRNTLPLSVFFFDCLYVDGQSLLDERTSVRHAALSELAPAQNLITRTDDIEQAENFFQSALNAGHEGIMAKSQNAPYEAGNRGSQWLKIKATHTLDLVVLAGRMGQWTA